MYILKDIFLINPALLFTSEYQDISAPLALRYIIHSSHFLFFSPLSSPSPTVNHSQFSQLNQLLHTMGKKRVLVGYGVDIDAVAGWLGSYGGEDSANDISRGMHCITF